MPTVLEEAIRLGADPQLAIAALSMPSWAPVTGAIRYNVPGYGNAEFIRPKSAEEVFKAATQLGESLTAQRKANPYAGMLIGDSPGQAQGMALQKRQQDIASAQFQQQLAAQERRAQEQQSLRRDLVAQEWQARQSIADQNRQAQVQQAAMRLAGGTGSRSARGATAPATGTTLADVLYGGQINLRNAQAEAESPVLQALSDAAASISAKYGYAPAWEDGVPVFSDDVAQKEYLTTPLPSGGTLGESLVKLVAGRSTAATQLANLQDQIKAATATGRLTLPVGTGRAPLSPLAQILSEMPGTPDANGQVTYSPAQVAEARSRLGWRGAYGTGTSAFGTNPAEQARAESARRARTMTPSAAEMAAPAPAAAAAPAPTQRFTLIPDTGTGSAPFSSLTATSPAGFLYDTLRALTSPGYTANPAVQAEVEQRRLAGEFPATTEYINQYPAWLRSLLASPGELTPASSATEQLIPTGGRTAAWPGPLLNAPAASAPAAFDSRTPAQRIAEIFGITF
jgi:hypothetical protein